MHGLLEEFRDSSRNYRSHGGAKTAFTCEALEDRKLLSSGFGFRHGLTGQMDYGSSRTAELGSFGAGRQGGFYGGGPMGLGGGMRNPTLLLTAPLLDGGSASTTPPAPGSLLFHRGPAGFPDAQDGSRERYSRRVQAYPRLDRGTPGRPGCDPRGDVERQRCSSKNPG